LRAAAWAVGDLLSARSQAGSILVVGGAGLNPRGRLERATIDDDVIALVDGKQPLINRPPRRGC